MNAVVWDLNADAVQRLDTDLRSSVPNSEESDWYFVAYVNGRPVGAAACFVDGSEAYLGGAAVIEAMRGQGLYWHLTSRRMRHLEQVGVELATIHARPTTSAPICKKMGFGEVCDFRIFLCQ